MLKQAALAQESIHATDNNNTHHISPPTKQRDLRRPNRYKNILLLPPTYSSTIRKIISGSTLIKTQNAGSFETINHSNLPTSHLGYTADEWHSKLEDDVDGSIGDDFPAKGGLRPLKGVIEDIISYHGFVLDDVGIDWDDVFNSIQDPYYEGDT